MAGFRPEIWNGEPIPYHEPIEVLRTRVRTSGNRAGAAIRALAGHPEPEAIAILVELTRSADPYLRRAGLEAIGYNPSGRNASDHVLSLLDDKNGFVVRTACEVAAVLGLAGAHDRILELIVASEEATRLSALRALECLWVPADFEKVFARYVNDRSAVVRKQAAWTLNKNVGPEHWEQVFELWSNDRLPRYRVWACSIAEKFGDRTILARLNALRSDPNGHVRRAVDRAVKVIGKS
jgi:HEAT repeat protein